MRSVVVVLLACAVAIGLAGSGHTQPSPPDVERARTLYTAAERALAENRLDEALRDYKIAYELTRDPALFYKIGVAYQKANLCRFGVSYFAAYLKYGKPTPDFFAITRERIRTCGYDPDALPSNLEDPTAGAGSGSGSSAAGSGSATGSAAGSGSAIPDAGSAVAVGSGSGSATPPPPKGKHRAGWILVGGAVALATVGAVLAYSANAAENDVSDLYVGLGGTPPAFNESTRQRFDDLVAEGERYQTLSIVSFSLSAVLGGLAAWRFATAKESVTITPSVTPTGAGASATWRF